MSTVYKLQSDKQFIMTRKDHPDVVFVHYYNGDPNAFGIIYSEDSRRGGRVLVGESAAGKFKELEVFGVRIGGARLKKLAKDLAIVDESGRTFHLMVNRQGLCLLRIPTKPAKWMRNNDRFGWSKYGVEPENGYYAIWNICDMSNGDVLVDLDDSDSDDDDDDEEGLRKVVEEKEKEVASLKAALRALVVDN